MMRTNLKKWTISTSAFMLLNTSVLAQSLQILQQQNTVPFNQKKGIFEESIIDKIPNWGKVKREHIDEFVYLKSLVKSSEDLSLSLKNDFKYLSEINNINTVLNDFQNKHNGFFYKIFTNETDNKNEVINFMSYSQKQVDNILQDIPNYTSKIDDLTSFIRSIKMEIDMKIKQLNNRILKAKKLGANVSIINENIHKLNKIKQAQNDILKKAKAHKEKAKTMLSREAKKVIFDLESNKQNLSLTRDYEQFKFTVSKLDINQIINAANSINSSFTDLVKQINALEPNQGSF
jgi:hypothetical protein